MGHTSTAGTGKDALQVQPERKRDSTLEELEDAPTRRDIAGIPAVFSRVTLSLVLSFPPHPLTDLPRKTWQRGKKATQHLIFAWFGASLHVTVDDARKSPFDLSAFSRPR